MNKAHKRLMLLASSLSAVVSAVFMFVSCAERDSRPDIVVVVLDACRPDHLSCYGYGRNTSPFIDSLAAQGARFADCRASAPWTAPSVASIFTSLPARSHGVLRGLAYERHIHGQELLDDSFATLAKTMQSAGYVTFGISGNAHVSRETGMVQGFNHFTNIWFPQSSFFHDEIKLFGKKLKSSRPFFLWLHYFNPHAPYVVAEPWTSRYARNPELIQECANRHTGDLRAHMSGIFTNRAIVETLIDLYDSNINMVDEYIRILFNEVLPERPRITVIISDHGESFLEHNTLGHANSLFEEEVRVPLIIVPPSAVPTGVVVTQSVSLLDLYPTLAEYAGAPAPATAKGRSLAGLISGNRDFPAMPFVSELDRGTDLKSIVADGWKLIFNATNIQQSMLFDLRNDPGERTNLFESNPAKREELTEALGKWVQNNPPFNAPRGMIRLTPEQESKMRALGYVR